MGYYDDSKQPQHRNTPSQQTQTGPTARTAPAPAPSRALIGPKVHRSRHATDSRYLKVLRACSRSASSPPAVEAPCLAASIHALHRLGLLRALVAGGLGGLGPSIEAVGSSESLPGLPGPHPQLAGKRMCWQCGRSCGGHHGALGIVGDRASQGCDPRLSPGPQKLCWVRGRDDAGLKSVCVWDWVQKWNVDWRRYRLICGQVLYRCSGWDWCWDWGWGWGPWLGPRLQYE